MGASVGAEVVCVCVCVCVRSAAWRRAVAGGAKDEGLVGSLLPGLPLQGCGVLVYVHKESGMSVRKERP